MKHIGIGALVMLMLLVAVGLLRGPQPAKAQAEEGLGWIDGTIVNPRGKSVIALGQSGDPEMGSNAAGVQISIRPQKGDVFRTNCDAGKNGYFTFRNLKPGIYEAFVDKGHVGDGEQAKLYKPQHIMGIVVEAGKRFKLDIVMNEGQELEDVGKPIGATTQKAIIISEELAKLQQQIDALKK